MRLVLTRDGQVRVIVDGRRASSARTAQDALERLAHQLRGVEPAAQLTALTWASSPERAWCSACREMTVRGEDGCPLCRRLAEQRRRENARARELCAAAGEPIPGSARETTYAPGLSDAREETDR